MNSKKMVLWVLLLSWVSMSPYGCAYQMPEPVERIAFPASEYDALAKTGTGIVKGQAFLKTRGGDVKVAAGNEITLNPVTSYSEQWFMTGYVEKKPLTEHDPRYEEYIMTTIADGDGRFTFQNVPPGRYYLTTAIVWEVPSYGAYPSQTGARVCKVVEVANDKTVNVVLTR
jgi:hypothetical protein